MLLQRRRSRPLSGEETFQASLPLALALSAQMSGLAACPKRSHRSDRRQPNRLT
ncbi:MAG: hypothetical protein M3Z25_10610 [Actinomycetota bacterium]|nr:hypothetical protein [Actinomycetota bacterium]